MKRVFKVALAVAMVMCTTSVFAQKFGRINTQEIIFAMPETKQMQSDLETYAQELQNNIETINVEFNTKLQEYQKTMNTMSDAVREIKEQELQDLQNRSRQFQELAQQEYQKKQGELYAPIIEKAKAAIDKVGEAGGYVCVFDVSVGSLAYFNETTLIDIADAVYTELGIDPAEAKKALEALSAGAAAPAVPAPAQ